MCLIGGSKVYYYIVNITYVGLEKWIIQHGFGTKDARKPLLSLQHLFESEGIMLTRNDFSINFYV